MSSVPPENPTTPPANWYPDPSQTGRLRWWDGTQWTDHTAPDQQAGVPGYGAPVPRKSKTGLIIGIVVAAVVVLAGVGVGLFALVGSAASGPKEVVANAIAAAASGDCDSAAKYYTSSMASQVKTGCSQIGKLPSGLGGSTSADGTDGTDGLKVSNDFSSESITGDSATVTYTIDGESGSGLSKVTVSGTYDYKLIKEGGSWKISGIDTSNMKVDVPGLGDLGKQLKDLNEQYGDLGDLGDLGQYGSGSGSGSSSETGTSRLGTSI
ncbi:DUF2510 domain-containing protein [Pseudoclavibacter sp. 13-3]|uniref:DUF2510 domain-containing protein n=1 Tax=Pseudoclavibacter sp. 13-3 TaxID=2901228 RepID=UPI001E3BD194|nr:DUF2510 domain-containing protein [Pseudoclavibacter sp. 13-3]MCD7101384.1 DUF2510 domain-containing protein [Pseudoclavibacter sp. 13-3]